MKYWHHGLLVAALAGLVMLVMSGVSKAGIAETSPIIYASNWRPDKERYNPGDVVRFRVWARVRMSRMSSIPIVYLDAFENHETGETYPAAFLPRVLEVEGDYLQISVRTLPDKMKPGTYCIKGWANAQVERRSLPAVYMSDTFEVVWPDKKE